ncbi:hypothetical protein [Sphingobacterium thalpophilum]|uniref:hypothetical protein n=1 Tax=Sphingobacterium thalpophilum TaxID=259 RepID=UPI0031E10C20
MRYTTLLYLLLSFLSLSAQEKVILYKGKKASTSPIVEKRDSTGLDPFKVAQRVELVFYTSNRMSWKNSGGKNLEELLSDGRLNIPTDSIAGRVELDPTQRADWQYTLYQRQLCEELMVAGCYEPRHLLVFYAKDNHPFAHIEICVSCAGAWISDNLRSFVVCPARMAALASMIAQIETENDIQVVKYSTRNNKQVKIEIDHHSSSTIR